MRFSHLYVIRANCKLTDICASLLIKTDLPGILSKIITPTIFSKKYIIRTMKKFILPAMAFLLVCCTKDPVEQIPEKAVSKAVEFRIAQSKDYSPAVYDGVQAELKLTLSKQDRKTGVNTVVWDTIFSKRMIRLYPAMVNQLIITKVIDGVFESKESLRVSQVISYSDLNNQVYQQGWSEDIPPSIPVKKVDVSL